jgi:hypothetical protein
MQNLETKEMLQNFEENEYQQKSAPALIFPGVNINKCVPRVEKEASVEELPPSSVLKRAISCDSLSSDTSVVLENLEEPNVTGYLCIGLEYEK